jgi:hypothetical protein
VLVLLIAHYLGWAFLQSTILANPDGPTALSFWIGQVGSVLVVVGIGLVGFRPALTVHADPDESSLHLEQGSDTLTLPLDTVERASVIDARHFHRHYRRYAAARVFAGRLPDTVLLLTRPDAGPVVVALASTDDHKRLLRLLQAAHAPVAESTPAHS